MATKKTPPTRRSKQATAPRASSSRTTNSLGNTSVSEGDYVVAISPNVPLNLSIVPNTARLVEANLDGDTRLHIEDIRHSKNSTQVIAGYYDPNSEIDGFGILIDKKKLTFLPLVDGLGSVKISLGTNDSLRKPLRLKPWENPVELNATLPTLADGPVTLLSFLSSGEVKFLTYTRMAEDRKIDCGTITLNDIGTSTRVFSLDFFDTLFWRRQLNPVDAFLPWAETIKKQFSLDQASVSLAQLRVEAESTARREKYDAIGSHEVNIQEIYEKFPAHVLLAECRAQAIDIEIDVENDSLIPDTRLLSRLAGWKRDGNKIVLTSDTYLPRRAFARFFAKIGIDISFFDGLYLSHEYNLPKPLGLIRKIADDFNVTPDRIYHIGDNIEADVHGGRLVGAEVEHYAPVAHTIADIENRIRKVASIAAPRKPFLEDFDGIHGFARRFASENPSAHHSVNTAIVAYGLGPLFCGYFSWLLEQCGKHQRKTVLFPTREGITLTRLFSTAGIASSLSGVRSFHLPVSRKALSFTNLHQLDVAQEVKNYFYNRKTPVSGKTLARLIGFTIESSQVPFKDLDYPIRAGDPRSERVLVNLISDNKFVAKILSYGGRKRAEAKTFLESFLRQQQISAADVMIADIGWSGGIFSKLASLLEEIDSSARAIARYVFVDRSALNLNVLGTDILGFVTEIGEPGSLGNVTINSKEILEQFLTPATASVVGYDRNGTVKLGKDASYPPQQGMQKSQLLDLSASYLKFVTEFTGTLPKFRPQNIEILLARLYAYPTAAELATIGNWTQDDNYAEHANRPCPTHTLIDHSLAFAQQYAVLDDFFALPNYWSFGAAAMYRPKDQDAIVLRALTGEWGRNAKGDSQHGALVTVERVLRNNQTEIDASHQLYFYLGPEGRGLLRYRFYIEAPTKVWLENLSGRLFIKQCRATVLNTTTNSAEEFAVGEIERAYNSEWHSNIAIGIDIPAFRSDVPKEIEIIIALHN